jgi:hypothetical protein
MKQMLAHRYSEDNAIVWRKGAMLKRIVLCTALITFGMVLSLNAQPQPSPVQPSPVKRTILQRTDVAGTNLERYVGRWKAMVMMPKPRFTLKRAAGST